MRIANINLNIAVANLEPALADGLALPAGDLARAASISPQTASSHLDKLFKAHLLAVEVQGRHHWYPLAPGGANDPSAQRRSGGLACSR
jgi:DNA-binding transcriptional ArsR family regulator